MEQLQPTPDTAPDWEQLRPALDDAMSELDDADRDAVLLRYFKNHDLRTVGATLGISDDAAQKRVSRAVERLREFFAKRGVTVGASGLAVAISANAVQAAPVGLALTISTAAALAGTTLATTAAITATKAIVMTTLQKTIVTATIAVLAGAGIYEARQASQLREQNQAIQRQQEPLTERMQQLQSDYSTATNRLSELLADYAQLKTSSNDLELLKLRGEVSQLRRQLQQNIQTMALQGIKQLTVMPQLFDLSQYPDSETEVNRSTANNVGTATPAALLQTWTWALRTGDANGLRNVWEFAPEIPEASKQNYVNSMTRLDGSERPSGGFEKYRLIELHPLGENQYLAIIEERTAGNLNARVMKQIFQQAGNDWRIFVPASAIKH